MTAAAAATVTFNASMPLLQASEALAADYHPRELEKERRKWWKPLGR